MAFRPVRSELDFPRDEARVRSFWREHRIFEKTLSSDTRRTGPSRGTYVFYEGPPTANGTPHNGHVLTRAMKDLYPRFFTMRGFDVPRKAGWDTHGLPVEVEVEKELRIHGKAGIEAYGVEPFVQRCIKSVFRYTEAWEKNTDQIAFWVDLPSAYVTYHKSYVESVWWALAKLFREGLLYQGHKVVWWWAQGGTALSSAEVGQGYKTVDDPSVMVAFPLEAEPETALLVWTTTPWTLSSNMYAAVHPDFTYATVEGEGLGRKLVLAKDLVPAVAKKLGKELRVVREQKGSELVGAKYVPPFDTFAAEAREAPTVHRVIPAKFVLLDASGIVHVAPAFGADDHEAQKEEERRLGERLPLFCAVKPDGTFVPAMGKYAGRWVKDCDKELQRELAERGLLVHAELYRHDYPFCWRSDTDPLIQFARPAWYIKTTARIDGALDENQRINWLPEHIKDGRFGDFLRNNVDWALSRERYWGTPLNVWVCTADAEHKHAPASVAEIRERNPRAFDHFDAAKAKDPSLSEHLAVHKPWIDAVTFPCPTCGAEMRRVPEVIDCWFDSGCMPFAQWGYPHAPGSKEIFERAFPADFISEAIDQTRGWFYSLLMVSTLVFGKSPYKTCVVLGHVCDREGKKESKQKGNYTPPEVILERVRMEFAAFHAPDVQVTASRDGVAWIAREDFEGLDFPGESARVHLYREGAAPLELELRPAKGLKRRIVALSAGDLARLGVTAHDDLKVMPNEVPKLPEGRKVWIEDPATPAPGADAFRWFFYASSPPWTNTRHSLGNVRLAQKDYVVRLRNVLSFFVIYANIDGWDPKARPGRPRAERAELDRWLLSELAQTTKEVGASLEAYRSYEAAQRLVAFVDALSNWYVRRSRDRFWAPASEPSGSEGTKWDAYATLHEALVTVAKLTAPFTPHFAEEIWQTLGLEAEAESVHLAAWPVADEAAIDAALASDMAAVREVVSLGLQVRAGAKLKVRQPLARADLIVSSPELRAALGAHRGLVAEELNVKEVRLVPPREEGGEESGEVVYQLKPNYKALGPRLGKKVQALKGVLAKADAGAIRAELAAKGAATVSVEGEDVSLTPGEIEVAVTAAEGYAAAGGRVGVVVLGTTVTEALALEGLAREVLSRVQAARKDLGLGFTDRIAVTIAGTPRLRAACEAHRATLASETLADAVELLEADGDAAAKAHDVDGEPATIRVSRRA